MSHVKSEQLVQAWGNGLGIRITAPLARAARIRRGQAVLIEVVEGGILVRPTNPARPDLSSMLASFDPQQHGGEAMAVPPLGTERL